MVAKLAAEFIGAFWLVLGGCGSAVGKAKMGEDADNNRPIFDGADMLQGTEVPARSG